MRRAYENEFELDMMIPRVLEIIRRKIEWLIFRLESLVGMRYFDACFLLTVAVLYFIAYPDPRIIMGDDFFVLSEKAWFSNKIDWLSHLLLFNQTRFTWSGDFHLFRPGLFIFYFIAQDVIWPLGIHSIWAWLFLINMLVFFCVYRFLSALCNKSLAVPLALWVLFPEPLGQMLFVWPHIQPYWIAIAFFSIGGTFAIQAARAVEPEIGRPHVLAGLSFFVGSLFHEFVIIATLLCGLYLLLYSIFTFAKKKTHVSIASVTVRTRSLLLLFVTPVVFYSIIRFLVFFLLDESAYSAGAMTRSWMGVPGFIKTILFQATASQSLTVGLAVFGLAVMVVMRKVLLGDELSRLKAAIILSAFTAIAALLVYGRVLPGGDIAPWYYPVLSFVCMGFIALLFHFLGSRWPSARLWLTAYALGVYGLGALLHIPELRASSSDYEREYGPSIKAAVAIRDDLDSIPQLHCFNGVMGNPDKIAPIDNNDADIRAGKPSGFNKESRHRMLSLLLYDKLCGVASGIPATYAFKSSSAMPVRVSLPVFGPENPVQVDLSIPSEILSGINIPKIKTSIAPGNIFEARGARKEITSDELKVYQYTSGIAGAQLSLRDEKNISPIMYNSALVFGLGEDPAKILTIAMHDADVFVSKGVGNTAQVLATGLVPHMSKSIALRVQARDGICDIYVNDFLVTQSAFCTLPAGKIGIYHFGNGSPQETPTGLLIFQ